MRNSPGKMAAEPKTFYNIFRCFFRKRLWLVSVLIVAALIGYGTFLVYPIFQSIKVAEKIVANTILYEQHPQNPNMYILVAGDSTAVGVGAINPQQSIAGRLGLQFPNADITNLGISGAKLKDLLLILKEHNGKFYDLVVLQIGANDITHLTPYNTIKKEISAIIALSSKHSTKTILLTAGNIGLAHVFHWPLSTFITFRTLNVRSIFMDETLKYKTVFYVDLFKEKKDDPFEKNIKKYYAPDFFHLTGDGYGIWFSQIQKQL